MLRFQKSISGKSGTSEHPMTSPGRKRRVLIWMERILLVSGLALVGFYGAARMESWLTSRAALKHFAADEAMAQPRTNDLTTNVDGEFFRATRTTECRLQALGRTAGQGLQTEHGQTSWG